MNPVTAFSLACGVIQVVDFSRTVVETIRHIHKNGSTDHADAKYMAEKLADLRHDILQSNLGESTKPGRVDQELQMLSEKCASTAEELIQEIKSLEANGPQRWLKSIEIAFKKLFKKSTIDGLQVQLDRYRRVLDTKILCDLRQRTAQMTEEQLAQFNNLDKNVQALIDGLRQGLQTMNQLKHVIRREHQSTRQHVTHAIKCQTDLQAEREYQTKYLQSLHYPTMRLREERVKSAHERTYWWIFEDKVDSTRPWSDFKQWLEIGEGIFWISGKPGSGKSTLMRYICHSEKTSACLAKWSEHAVILVSHFFWNAGDDMQKTIEGLYRSILHQLMSRFPQLITLPTTKETWPGQDYIEIWTEARLEDALSMTISEVTRSHKILFLIDGLDETEMDHRVLIDCAKSRLITQMSKCCLSSRPKKAFHENLSSFPMLRLQDLTKDDIKAYVHDVLAPTNSPHVGSMSLEIVAAAEGVFLWAELVAKNIKTGMSNGDPLATLKERLYHMPTDIEKLYEHMLARLDSVYKPQAARCLQLALNLERDHDPLLTFSLALHEEQDDSALSFSKLSLDETYDLCSWAKGYLPVVSAGLLEISDRKPQPNDFDYSEADSRMCRIWEAEKAFLNNESKTKPQEFLDFTSTPRLH